MPPKRRRLRGDAEPAPRSVPAPLSHHRVVPEIAVAVLSAVNRPLEWGSPRRETRQSSALVRNTAQRPCSQPPSCAAGSPPRLPLPTERPSVPLATRSDPKPQRAGYRRPCATPPPQPGRPPLRSRRQASPDPAPHLCAPNILGGFSRGWKTPLSGGRGGRRPPHGRPRPDATGVGAEGETPPALDLPRRRVFNSRSMTEGEA